MRTKTRFATGTRSIAGVALGLVGLLLPARAESTPPPLPGTIATVAGGGVVGDGGSATIASLYSPSGVAVDSAGNLFIADYQNARVRRVDTSGVITTVAGNGTQGFSGDGGQATSAAISTPQGVTIDAAGNIFIADRGNRRIRMVNTSGVITTVAGNGSLGFTGDGGQATSASIGDPEGIAVDSAGNLFIADSYNMHIRVVDTGGVITTVAGDGSAGFAGDGGQATSASLDSPAGVAVDSAGNLFIVDKDNRRIRMVDTSGVITTVAGNGSGWFSGDGGQATSAAIGTPQGVTLDAAGNLFIADQNWHRIRMVNTSGVITTVAGNGSGGFSGDGGPATSASLNNPFGVAVDSTGNVFIAEKGNHRIRKVNTSGVISTVAGSGSPRYWGDGGPATLAWLGNNDDDPAGIALDSAGNLFIGSENRVRRMTTGGEITTVAGNGECDFGGDGGPAAAAPLCHPFGVAVDSVGNVFIAEQGNHCIRKVNTSGVITTVAGNGAVGFAGDGGPATSAMLSDPFGVAVDAAGNVFIADRDNSRIRKVDAIGVITTVAGNGTAGFSGDGNEATSAGLNWPEAVAVDPEGNLFIADTGNGRIRRVDTSGIITTVAGGGSAGDGVPATLAYLSGPRGVAVDSAWNVFIADRGSDRVRKVDANGVITTVAGNGTSGLAGDGGPATSASINDPWGVAVDSAGNIFIADSHNNRIRCAFGVASPRVVGTCNPARGGDTGSVTLRVAILGGVADGSSALLRRVGTADLLPGEGLLHQDGRTLSATFDLRGKDRGLWDVVVTDAAGDPIATLVNAFTIEEGRAPDIWVDIVGRSAVRPAQQSDYCIVYGNRGNVDCPATVLQFSCSEPGARYRVEGADDYRPFPARLFGVGQWGRPGVIYPGATHAIRLSILAPSGISQMDLEVAPAITEGPFPWDAVTSDSVLETIGEPQWTDMVTGARGVLGETWDEVLAALRTFGSSPGERPTSRFDFSDVLAYYTVLFGSESPVGPARLRTASTAQLNRLSTGQELDSIISLETIAEPTNPTQTFVIFHGQFGLSADIRQIAERTKAIFPSANVYPVDASTLMTPQEYSPAGFADVADNIPVVAGYVADMLRQKVAAGRIDAGTTTFIGHSYGCYIAYDTSILLGRVRDALLFDPGRATFTWDRVLRSGFTNISVSFVADSFLDNHNPMAKYNLLVYDSVPLGALKAHHAGLTWFLGLPPDQALFWSSLALPWQATGDRLDWSVYGDGSIHGPLQSPLDTLLLPNSCIAPKPPPVVMDVAVVASRDPNEKCGPQGRGAERYVNGETAGIDYTVFFENMATATAPAQVVLVTDALDATVFDLETFELGQVSFGQHVLVPPPLQAHWQTEIDLRPNVEMLVRVRAWLDKGTGIVTWRLESIDPAAGGPVQDPLAGFLPPNVEPPEGDGAVSFRVNRRPDLASGATVRNMARIVFDDNDPIDTEWWVNTIDSAPPSSTVLPLPSVQKASQIALEWEGADEGSGVQDYTVFVSVDGGPLSPWLEATTMTRATYPGAYGHTYAFGTLARDRCGNAEATPVVGGAAVLLEEPRRRGGGSLGWLELAVLGLGLLGIAARRCLGRRERTAICIQPRALGQ